MFDKPRHARLAAAVIAAATLHALVLLIIFQNTTKHHITVTQNNQLQVTLFAPNNIEKLPIKTISNDTKQPTQTSKQKPIRSQKPQENHRHIAVTEKPKNENAVIVLKQTKKAALVTKEIITLNQPQVSMVSAKHAPIEISNKQTKLAAKHDNQQSNNMLVPTDIQAHILMQVGYPRQAQRHGWQGKVELQLHVQQQNIQHITLLTSSGHPILDRAAYRGLMHIKHISLSNGFYRMPIVFRLQ